MKKKLSLEEQIDLVGIITACKAIIEEEKKAVAREIFDMIRKTPLGKSKTGNDYYIAEEQEELLKPLMKKYNYDISTKK